MIRVIVNAAAIGMAISILWILCSIAYYGKFTIIEPNAGILYSEIALLVGVLILSTIALISSYRNKP